MQEIASTPMCKKLIEARLDPCIKAVVIRIDSPGERSPFQTFQCALPSSIPSVEHRRKFSSWGFAVGLSVYRGYKSRSTLPVLMLQFYCGLVYIMQDIGRVVKARAHSSIRPLLSARSD